MFIYTFFSDVINSCFFLSADVSFYSIALQLFLDFFFNVHSLDELNSVSIIILLWFAARWSEQFSVVFSCIDFIEELSVAFRTWSINFKFYYVLCLSLAQISKKKNSEFFGNCRRQLIFPVVFRVNEGKLSKYFADANFMLIPPVVVLKSIALHHTILISSDMK